ncbi:hypothetical protein [Microbacterium jejuense]|uniref:hypothetical protein n=1 Tax=Microbacterium jejuense TaxID=1263637 RepID=UPI0031EAFC67
MNDLTYFASTLHTQRTAQLRHEAEIRELRDARDAEAGDPASARVSVAHGFSPRRRTRRSSVAAAR